MKVVGLRLCFTVMSTSGSGIRMTQDLTDELNNSTASTFRRKFRLLLNYFFHKYLVEASVEML